MIRSQKILVLDKAFSRGRNNYSLLVYRDETSKIYTGHLYQQGDNMNLIGKPVEAATPELAESLAVTQINGPLPVDTEKKFVKSIEFVGAGPALYRLDIYQEKETLIYTGQLYKKRPGNAEQAVGKEVRAADVETVYRLGLQRHRGIIPVEDTLIPLAQEFGLKRNALYKAVTEGRVIARRSGDIWLSTREAIQEAINAGRLRP